MRLSLPPRTVLGFVLAALAVLLTFAMDEFASRRTFRVSAEVTNALEVLDATHGLALRLALAESAERGYLLTDDPRYIGRFEEVRRMVDADLERLGALLDDDPAQLQRLAAVEDLVRQNMEIFHEAFIEGEENGAPRREELLRLRESRNLMETTLSALAELRGAELRELQERRVEREETLERAALARWVSSGLLLVLIGLAFASVRREFLARERISADRQRLYDQQQRLVGIVGHDLRSPLAAIAGTAALLLRGSEGPDRARVKRIESSARRMELIIRDLLDYTQAGVGGGLRIDRHPTRMHELCRQVVEEALAGAPGRQIDLVCEGPDEGQWDPGRVQQVLSNLLSNALKYGDPLQPITVRAVGGQNDVVLTVHNAGEPIPPDELPLLFRPFQSGSRTANGGQHSLGLGLYIVHEIVRAHHGELRVTSTREHGTLVEVRLPRRPLHLAGSESHDVWQGRTSTTEDVRSPPPTST